MELLTDTEIRVLGSLIEKELTTPEYYPLSLNALINACNQSSNRDPVVQYDEATVKAAVDRLRKYSLVRSIQRADARVMKYMHLLNEALGLDRPERAVLDVLMLRGPQTLGEIRTRAARLFEFATLDDAEATLHRLIERSAGPLAAKLARQPGQKEARYAHLLSVEPENASASPQDAEADEVPHRTDRLSELERAVDALKGEVSQLRAELAEFRRVFE